MNKNKSPQDALKYLKEGNARFHENRLEHPRRDPQTREKLTDGQNPFAALLTCADSRVSPDLVFDKGLGDLFVIRNAGNVAGSTAIASIEFAIAQLGVNLVVVMGHDQCGAVQAAIDGVEMGHIRSITGKILPAVREAEALNGNILENAIRINARKMAEQLRKTNPIIKPAYENGKLQILSAVYSLETGQVTFDEEFQ
jgi:carbonic anhydrase